MNLFKENRWLHLMLYIGMSALFTQIAFKSLNDSDIIGRLLINAILFGLIAVVWEIIWHKIDWFDVLWSAIGAVIGTLFGVYCKDKSLLAILSWVLIGISAAWWAILKYKLFKK